MELWNRVFAGGCAVVALIALLVPQPVSWILMALLCVAFTVGTLRVRAGRWSQLFGLGLSLAVLVADLLDWPSVVPLVGAALVSTCALRSLCGYCITTDIAAAWRKVAVH
ncbi:MAG: hypothetical protein NT180_05310 [Actinobacteria bacterium]|nr:hypothetical protein [Actinomycetota bacterium]